MSDAMPPLTHALLFWLPTFLLGVLVGRSIERHQLDKESLMRSFVDAYNGWYSRYAPIVVTLVALVAVVGLLIGTTATITNAQQDRRADAATRAVQKCFDDYAIAQSASSQAVREASIVKDEATKVFNQALNDEGRAFKVLVKNLRDRSAEPHQVARLYRTLARRDRAGRAVERAQADLDKAREENPVPAAPSTFCSVKP